MWVIMKKTPPIFADDSGDRKGEYEVGYWIHWGTNMRAEWNPIYTYADGLDAQAMVHYLNGGCLEHLV